MFTIEPRPASRSNGTGDAEERLGLLPIADVRRAGQDRRGALFGHPGCLEQELGLDVRREHLGAEFREVQISWSQL
jgi:hypothetical protein